MPSRQVARPRVTRMTDRQRTCRFSLSYNRRGAGSKKVGALSHGILSLSHIGQYSHRALCVYMLVLELFSASVLFLGFCLTSVSPTARGSCASCHESRGLKSVV